ncbi:MAG: hypothetical protein NVSMB70_06290 [Chamaesiphon sp.]
MPIGWVSAGLAVYNALSGPDGSSGGGGAAPPPQAPITINTGQSTANTLMTKAAADVKSNAAKQAGDINANAALAAGNIEQGAYQKFADQGAMAQDRLSAGFTKGGEFDKTFTMADATNSDAMKFAQQQGKLAIENGAAARGGLLGTNEDQAAIKFAEGTAGQFQQQAFQQWRQQQQDRIAGIGGLAKQGMDASGRIADAQGNAQLAAGGSKAGAAISMGDANAAFLNTAGNNMTGMAGDVATTARNLGKSGIWNGVKSLFDGQNPESMGDGTGAYTDPGMGNQGDNVSSYSAPQYYNNPSAYSAPEGMGYIPDNTNYTPSFSMGNL